MKILKPLLFVVWMLSVIVISGTVLGQDTGETVTDDQVNAIAKRMYCPVCENIPFDTCGTAAGADWRYEIRLMLEDGFTEEQIRTDFVNRFGERVVGTPQDPILWALSVIAPWLIIALGLYFGFRAMRNLRKEGAVADTASSTSGDRYYDALERDISG